MIAYEVAKVLIKDVLFAPGGPYDRRLRIEIDKQINLFAKRQELADRVLGKSIVRATSAGGLRGRVGSVGGSLEDRRAGRQRDIDFTRIRQARDCSARFKFQRRGIAPVANTIYYGRSAASAGSNRLDFEEQVVRVAGNMLMETDVLYTVNDTRIRNPDRGTVATWNATGLAAVDYTITGKVLAPRESAPALRLLRTFAALPSVTPDLPNGAFGVTLDRFEGAYDLAPTSSGGLVVLSTNPAKVEAEPDAVGFVIKLGYVGSQSRLA